MRQENGYRYEESFLHIWAPAITDYVEWVLEKAVRSGKKRLYFLARDGWMMYHAARRIIDKRMLDIEISYLKVSRYAIRSAQYYLLGEKSLDLICIGGIDVTFERIMKRALLTDEEARRVARIAGYEDRYDTVLNYRQIQELKQQLKDVKILFKYIEQHSKINYENAVGYLRQEGLMEDKPYALVDSGWIGTLQMSIQHLVSAETGKERRIYGYYYGLYDVPKDAEREQYESYYFGKKSVWKKVYFSNCLFETVFSSPGGMTIGYEKKDDKYVAVESQRKNPNKELMLEFKSLLMMYVDERLRNKTASHINCIEKAEKYEKVPDMHERKSMAPSESSIYVCDKSRYKNNKSLARLMSKPTTEEAEAYGSMKFCDDIIEFKLQSVAAEWDAKELKKQCFVSKMLIKLNIKKEELHDSAWPEGSIANYGSRVGYHLWQERLYKLFMYTRKAILGR